MLAKYGGSYVSIRDALEYEKKQLSMLKAKYEDTRQCSIGVNAKDLAMMAATLANGGKNPVTGKQVMKTGNVPEVSSP